MDDLLDASRSQSLSDHVESDASGADALETGGMAGKAEEEKFGAKHFKIFEAGTWCLSRHVASKGSKANCDDVCPPTRSARSRKDHSRQVEFADDSVLFVTPASSADK